MPPGIGYKRRPGVFDALLATQQLGSNDLARKLTDMGAPVGATNLLKDLTDPLKALNGVNQYVPETAGLIGDILEAIGRPSSMATAARDQGPGVFGGSMPVTRNSQAEKFGSDLRGAVAPHVNTSDPNAPFLPPETQRAIAGGIRDDISQRGIMGVADPTDFAGVLGGKKVAKSFIDMATNVPSPKAKRGRQLLGRPAKGGPPGIDIFDDMSIPGVPTPSAVGGFDDGVFHPLESISEVKSKAITEVNLRGMDPDAALEVARKAPHLIRDKTGQYVGAPRGIATPEALQALRDHFDHLVVDGQMGGDWYDRTRRGVQQMAGPTKPKQRLTSSTLAQFSAQADPNTNLNFALKGLNQEAFGARPDRIRTGDMDDRFFNSVAETGEASLGPKTGVFRGQFDPTMAGETTAVNDIWHARAWGFVEADGSPWSSGLSPQQHAWLDAETILAGERANLRRLGGKTDWDSRSVQADPWVAAKGQDLHRRFPNRFPTVEAGLEEAAKSYPDHFDKRTVNLTHELVPGAGTGHLPGVTGGDAATRAQFTKESPDFRGPGGRDIIMDAANLQTLPTRKATGFFDGPEGVEVNPAFSGRVLMPSAKDAGGSTLREQDIAGLDATETLRSLMAMQHSTPYHQAIPVKGAVPGNAGALAGHSSAMSIPLEKPVSAGQVERLQSLLSPHGLDFMSDTGGGLTVSFKDVDPSYKTPWERPRTPSEMKKLLKEIAPAIKKILPQSGEAHAARVVGNAPGVEDFDTFTGFVQVANANTGTATRNALEKFNHPLIPKLHDNISDSPRLRKWAKDKADFDESWAVKNGDRVRTDQIRLLRIFSEGGLSGLREALNKGIALPIAAGVMYELSQQGGGE